MYNVCNNNIWYFNIVLYFVSKIDILIIDYLFYINLLLIVIFKNICVLRVYINNV